LQYKNAHLGGSTVMKYVFIHGATASNRSFAYLDRELQAKDAIYLEYDKDSTAKDNLKKMRSRLEQYDDNFYYVCHSLGGIYGVYLQNEFKIASKGAISLATPFNGSDLAIWGAMMMPSHQLFHDITPRSDFISSSREIDISIPWTQVVSTGGGVPWLLEDNDGVVTRKSMTCRDDIDYIEVERNHYEILLSRQVVTIIKKHTKNTHTKGKKYV